MPDAIIYIDPDQPMNLQNQIRQRLVDGILNGSFAPGMKLPSSRKLARQLNVARNTVVAAYQQLIADGYLVSRQRSGIFVNEEMLEARVGHRDVNSPAAKAESAAWQRRIREMPAQWRNVRVSLTVAVVVSFLTQRKDPPKKLTNADGEAMDLSDRLGTLPLFSRAD